MDDAHFDALTRVLSSADSRRGLLAFLAALPVLGGLLAWFEREDAAAKERRKRRKKRHKKRHNSGKGKHKRKNQKAKCTPQPVDVTCAGKCGAVQNNCKQTVECPACTCSPPCDTCQTCNGTTCENCDPCCNEVCCQQAGSVCHASSEECCLPDSTAVTCDGKCGPVLNNCGFEIACGPCTCDPACLACKVCDEDTGDCVADPSQQGDACGPAQTCDHGTVNPQGSCNASGTCVPGTPVSCGACEQCDGNACAACSPCCEGVCCAQATAICHVNTGVCCDPDSKATTCDGKCGPVVNNCGVTVQCGPCVCDPACPACQICDVDTGDCVADPDQQGDACGPAQTCEHGSVTPQGSCNASGNCAPAAPVSCSPYTECDGTSCAGNCANSGQCVNGYYCNGVNLCVAKLPNGQACNQDGQCSSGHCVDGYCCNTACDGTCQACNLSGKLGTCTTEANGSACGGGNVCCAGACVDCCTNGQCSNPQPICVSNTCTACSGANPCPGGQVCCGGSCFSGICCAGEECAPTGNTCNGSHECRCGSGATCGFPTPSCCGTPGGCTYTGTDRNNCGTCGTVCPGSKPCYKGTCCTPTTCSALGKTCGTWPDGCGGWLECGGCPAKQVCDEGVCQACTVCASGCSATSIDDAIFITPAGGTVRICPGRYADQRSLAFITKSLTLVGAGVGPNGTILDADGGDEPPVDISGSLSNPITVSIRDMILTGGNTTGNGGGLDSAGAHVTLTRVFVKGNVANDRNGGGIWIQGGSLTLNAAVVSENSVTGTSASGGGIATLATSVTVNAFSSVTKNTAGIGGGIRLSSSQLTLNADSSVEENTSTIFGGGIFIFAGATATLNAGSSVNRNKATINGGGIFNSGTVVRNAGSDISNNSPNQCVNNDGGTGCS